MVLLVLLSNTLVVRRHGRFSFIARVLVHDQIAEHFLSLTDHPRRSFYIRLMYITSSMAIQLFASFVSLLVVHLVSSPLW
jgi:hypothetical protein